MSVPPRSNPTGVKALLDRNYDLVNSPSLLPYIRRASALTDRAVVMAGKRGFTLSTEEQLLIEETLAAYFYCKTDAMYTTRSTDKASGGFVMDPTTPEVYKKMAQDVDPSGSVNALLNRLFASGGWLGKTLDEQIPYDTRMGGSDL